MERHDDGLVARGEARKDLGALDAVERGDRFVADQDRPAVVERARNRGALLLPAGKLARAGKQRIAQADEIQHRGDFADDAPRRPDQGADVVPGRMPIEPAHVDVVKHRERLHQGAALRNQRHALRQAAIEKIEQGRLAGAAAAHHGDALAGPDRQIDPMQNGPPAVSGCLLRKLDQDAHGRSADYRSVSSKGPSPWRRPRSAGSPSFSPE